MKGARRTMTDIGVEGTTVPQVSKDCGRGHSSPAASIDVADSGGVATPTVPSDIIGALRRTADELDPSLLSKRPLYGLVRYTADAQTLRDLAEHIERGGLFAQLVSEFEDSLRVLTALREGEPPRGST